MADSDTYNRIRLDFSTPWAKKGGAAQDWSLLFSLSGDPLTSEGDAESTANDLVDPISRLTSGATSYLGYWYYEPGSRVHAFNAEYAVGARTGTATGYNGAGLPCQLEVVIVLSSPIGKDVKGRPTFLRKHVHDVSSSQQSANAPQGLNQNCLDAIQKWSTGVGPKNLVAISPTKGTAAAPFQVTPYLATRQMRRAAKKK